MWLAAGLVVLSFWIGVKKPGIVPKGVQNFLEVAHNFVKDNIVYHVMSSKDARTWYPFIGTIFFFILMMNVVGLIPYIGFTPTPNIFVAAALALSVYLLAIGI